MADNSDDQMAVLVAENAVLRQRLNELISASENFAAYVKGEHGVPGTDTDDHNVYGLPLAIDNANQALSTPNTKAMRMVEVVKAAEAVSRMWHSPDYTATAHIAKPYDDLRDALAALTDGEQG